MMGLAQLLSDPAGNETLRRRGLYADMDAFVEALQPRPSRELLDGAAGGTVSGERRLVYSGQQLYPDYRRNILRKLAALEELRGRAGIDVLHLGLDTDRTGSESAMTTLSWKLGDGVTASFTRVKAARYTELRFVLSERERRLESLRKLREYFRKTLGHRAFASIEPRYLRLEALLAQDDPLTLAELNHAITRMIMGDLGFDFPLPRLSGLLDRKPLIARVELWLERRDACIAAFNEAIAELKGLGVEPGVGPLSDDALPLHYSCPEDQSRIRLRLQTRGSDRFAVGHNRCGTEVRFHLGAQAPDLAELTRTGRWSPDVHVPVFLNSMVSGLVVGESSACYGLVLNRVLERAFEETPVPMLLVARAPGSPAADGDYSALREFLTADLRGVREHGPG